jgi:methyl-accepting chemotaxis protein
MPALSRSRHRWIVVLLIYAASLGAGLGVSAYGSEALLRDERELFMTLMRMRRAQVTGFFTALIDESRFWAQNRIMRQAVVDFAGGWQQLDADAGAQLRRLYVDENPYPEGQRDNFEVAPDGSRYSQVHAYYHYWLRTFLLHRSLYDVLLLDRDGNLVYTSLKERDFGTNLLTGPYRESALGRAFREAVDNPYPSYVAVYDFEPYAASDGDPALFTASPVLADDGELLGVISFQISPAPIDRMFQELGARRTGKAFPVGSDYKLRSRTRYTDTAAMLDTSVDTETVRAALAGESGQRLTRDYRGVPVLSTYAPLEIEGLQWAVFAELDEEEYREEARELRNTALAASLLAGTLASALALLLLRARPATGSGRTPD